MVLSIDSKAENNLLIKIEEIQTT